MELKSPLKIINPKHNILNLAKPSHQAQLKTDPETGCVSVFSQGI